jgi:hypothetical protein
MNKIHSAVASTLSVSHFLKKHLLPNTNVFFKLIQLLQECAIHLGMWASRILMTGIDFATIFFFFAQFSSNFEMCCCLLGMRKENLMHRIPDKQKVKVCHHFGNYG